MQCLRKVLSLALSALLYGLFEDTFGDYVFGVRLENFDATSFKFPFDAKRTDRKLDLELLFAGFVRDWVHRPVLSLHLNNGAIVMTEQHRSPQPSKVSRGSLW